MPRYNPAVIEPKWQKYWEEHRTFAAPRLPTGEKIYVLDMFPYPSGDGLHVGHPEGYTATDIVCRFQRMQGRSVMHPMGWDAFGLPAEQHAKKTGTHPRTTTEKNIANFRRQLKMLGFSYDWDRELATTDVRVLPLDAVHLPGAVRHLVRSGRSRRAGRSPSCRSPTEVQAAGRGGRRALPRRAPPGLPARGPGQLVPGPGHRAGQRGGGRRGERARRASGGADPAAPVDAADHRLRRPAGKGPRPARLAREHQALAAELDRAEHRGGGRFLHRHADRRRRQAVAGGIRVLAWSTASTTASPRSPATSVLRIYTTRPDTLFGATYMVIAPEHPFVERLDHAASRPRRSRPIAARPPRKSDLDRTDLAKEKTGVFTGSYAINPVNGKAIPIWVADYVLISYGTGAIMAVPAHDTRDFEFAKQFDLPIIAGGRSGRGGRVRTATTRAGRAAWRSSATARRSTPAAYNGLTTAEFKRADRRGPGQQGAGPRGGQLQAPRLALQPAAFLGRAVPDPARAGRRRASRPAWSGPCRPRSCRWTCPQQMTFDAAHDRPEPPLEKAPADWLYVTLDGKRYKRETNTMPQWAGSCWYYLRFLDPQNDQALVDPAGREGVDAGRSLRGRGGARRAAPALRPLLAQGALRPRLREHARAVPEAGQPGDDPRRDGVHRLSGRDGEWVSADRRRPRRPTGQRD